MAELWAEPTAELQAVSKEIPQADTVEERSVPELVASTGSRKAE